MVGHGDGHGQCFRCRTCRHWIRPHKAAEACRDCLDELIWEAGLCPSGHELQFTKDPGTKYCGVCLWSRGPNLIQRWSPETNDAALRGLGVLR